MGKPSSVRTITVGKGKYRTIKSIYPILPNTKVIISPGTYNEQLTLVSDVVFELQAGAIIDYSVTNFGATNTDATVVTPYTATNCVVQGAGTIKRSNSNCPVIFLNNGSVVTINGVQIKDGGVVNGAILIIGADVTVNTNITTISTSIMIQSGSLKGSGNLYCEDDYCLFISCAAGPTSCSVDWKGNVTSLNNSAIGIYGGRLTYEGTATSYGLFGFEMGGGDQIVLRNSTFESKVNLGYQDGDALSKYGGELLTLDNCRFICANPNAYSLSEEGHATSIYLASDCYATNPKSPLITTTGPGQLIIQ